VVYAPAKGRALLLGIGALLCMGVDPPPPPASPAPVVTPVPVSSASSAPAPVPMPAVVMLPPDALPQILWIGLSSSIPHAGDTLAITVVASSNVASVELRVGGYGTSMNKTDVGHFESTSQVPSLPLFMNHNLTLQIIARNSAGISIEQDTPIQVR
jgi:hypothetical protein